MLDQLVMPVVEILKALFSVPAVQGMAVAVATEAIKKSPVGPTQGTGIRILAALLAVATQVAGAVADGDVAQVDVEVLGQHLAEALSAFLAAVGAWQLARKK